TWKRRGRPSQKRRVYVLEQVPIEHQNVAFELRPGRRRDRTKEDGNAVDRVVCLECAECKLEGLPAEESPAFGRRRSRDGTVHARPAKAVLDRVVALQKTRVAVLCGVHRLDELDGDSKGPERPIVERVG